MIINGAAPLVRPRGPTSGTTAVNCLWRTVLYCTVFLLFVFEWQTSKIPTRCLITNPLICSIEPEDEWHFILYQEFRLCYYSTKLLTFTLTEEARTDQIKTFLSVLYGGDSQANICMGTHTSLCLLRVGKHSGGLLYFMLSKNKDKYTHEQTAVQIKLRV